MAPKVEYKNHLTLYFGWSAWKLLKIAVDKLAVEKLAVDKLAVEKLALDKFAVDKSAVWYISCRTFRIYDIKSSEL